MNRQLLFTDGSVNVQSKIGYGACLLLAEEEQHAGNLAQKVLVKRFENTNSTKLELQTLLWALDKLHQVDGQIVIHTDSQTIVDLLDRRSKLEENDFKSKKSKPLNNGDLYRSFFTKIDLLNCEFIKIKGHQPSFMKNEIEQIFALVDKASRKALRKENLL